MLNFPLTRAAMVSGSTSADADLVVPRGNDSDCRPSATIPKSTALQLKMTLPVAHGSTRTTLETAKSDERGPLIRGNLRKS